MNIMEWEEEVDLKRRTVAALERIAAALEAAFPEPPDTEFDPNEGTIDFENPDSVDVQSPSKKEREDSIVDAERDFRY